MANIKVTQEVGYVVGKRVETVSATQEIAYVVAANPPPVVTPPPVQPPEPPVLPPVTPPPPFTPDEPACPIDLSFLSLRQMALKMLGENLTTPVYWSDAEIGRYVNDAYRETAKESGCLETWEALRLSSANSGIIEYSATATLSDYVGTIMRVSFDDRRIESTTNFELDRLESNWENRTGYISNYVITSRGNKIITTYKKWDGTVYHTDGPWANDAAYGYQTWASGNNYAVGARVTLADTSTGRLWGYECIIAHDSTAATTKPISGATWTSYWSPLALMVWCKKIPALMVNDTDVPDLPPWCQIMLAFRAAAKALGKYGEQRNPQTQAAYNMMADEYAKLLKGYMANREPEKVDGMGSNSMGNQLRKPRPWDRVVS